MELVSTFEALVREVSWVMTRPTFASFLIVVAGWLFARRRTVTGMIQAAGAVGAKHHSAFHRVFAAARWSLDDVGLAVFGLALRLMDPAATIFLAVDDTLARKRGMKVFGVGMHYDPVLSSRGKAIVNWGHSWVVLGVLVEPAILKGRWFCLPVVFRLYRSERTVAKGGGRYRTRPELAVEMLHLLCCRYPERRFHVVGDSTYSGKSVVRHLPANGHLTGRLPMDAALYAPPPRGRTRGRPRKRGRRLPSPEQMLSGKTRVVDLDIYGRHERARVAVGVALWYGSAGSRRVRVVAVEPLSTGRTPQAFYTTATDATAEQVLTWYARRWAVEVTFQESKGHLGFQEPQGWTRRAVERTAPVAMLLYSLIVVWFAGQGHRHLAFPNRPWYRTKREPSFADMLTTLRRQCLRQRFLQTPAWDEGSRKSLQVLLDLCSRAA
jgi:hypothetical protein